MNTLEKIKRSWWVLISFIFFLNGFGFIYIGAKHNNRNWILEGIIYELPWLLYFIMFGLYGTPIGFNVPGTFVFLSVVMMLVSIIRSIWVAVKLADVYDNEEKYTIQSTVLTKQTHRTDDNTNSTWGCCLCILVIFIIFMIIIL